MVSHWGYEIPALFLYRPTNTFCPARTNTVDRRAAPTYSRLEQSWCQSGRLFKLLGQFCLPLGYCNSCHNRCNLSKCERKVQTSNWCECIRSRNPGFYTLDPENSIGDLSWKRHRARIRQEITQPGYATRPAPQRNLQLNGSVEPCSGQGLASDILWVAGLS